MLAVAVLAGSACKGRTAAADKAWDALDYNTVEGARAKVELVKGFLAKYPNSAHTGEAAADAVYFLAEELKAPQEADELLATVLGRVKDAEQRRQVELAHLGVLATLGRVDELRATAASISRDHQLSFPESFEIADAAIKAQVWDLALASLETAGKLTTPEAFRAEHPDREYPDERVQRMVRWRKVDVAALTGWALANTGKVDEAMAAFEAGKADDLTLYLGNSGTRLGGLYGRAMLLTGRADAALQVLVPEVVFGDDADAAAACRAAFIATRGSQAGYDDFLAAERVRMARMVDDFELPDYAGTKHRFSDFAKGKVTLLAFWFPT